MSAWTICGGRWTPCGGIPLEDRGFRYGMSVFETVAIFRGTPLFFEAHRERLARALSELGWAGMVLPEGLAGGLGGGEVTGVFRWYVTAGPGGPGGDFAGEIYGIFEEAEVGTDFPAARIATCGAPYLSAPGGWKTGNYWQNVRAWAEARASGADEALVFEPSGSLVSASMGNLFLEVDGRWQTPALGRGARDGVVRAWVLGQLPAEEVWLDAESVRRATAAFVTGSRAGVRAVCEIDGRPLRTGVTRLQETYRRDVLFLR